MGFWYLSHNRISFLKDACAAIGTKCLRFCLCLYIRPFFVCESREGSGQTVHLRSLGWNFAAQYRNPMNWFLYVLGFYPNN